jgi:hypothetical protein
MVALPGSGGEVWRRVNKEREAIPVSILAGPSRAGWQAGCGTAGRVSSVAVITRPHYVRTRKQPHPYLHTRTPAAGSDARRARRGQSARSSHCLAGTFERSGLAALRCGWSHGGLLRQPDRQRHRADLDEVVLAADIPGRWHPGRADRQADRDQRDVQGHREGAHDGVEGRRHVEQFQIAEQDTAARPVTIVFGQDSQAASACQQTSPHCYAIS